MLNTPTPIKHIAAPEVLAIPILECGEKMVDARLLGGIAIGPSPEIPDNMDYTWMRESIYQKLINAQKLLPVGLRFCLYEAYRSLALQKMLFDTRYAHYQNTQSWDLEYCFHETCKIVSPVINLDGTPNVPPHSTGAAVDVYLIDEEGNTVDMGMSVDGWVTDDAHNKIQTDSTKISPQAHEMRHIMGEALLTEGFINYPYEYWHWSYGDRYGAYISGAPHALYGSM